MKYQSFFAKMVGTFANEKPFEELKLVDKLLIVGKLTAFYFYFLYIYPLSIESCTF